MDGAVKVYGVEVIGLDRCREGKQIVLDKFRDGKGWCWKGLGRGVDSASQV